MNARAKRLLEEVLALPRDERAELVRDVISTLAAEDTDAATEWGELVRQRADDVLARRNVGPEARPAVAAMRERLRHE
jgi:hypothetical protein